MKGCSGWVIAIIAWFVFWFFCISIGEKCNISPFSILFGVIICTIILGLIGIYIYGRISNYKFDKKESKCKDIQSRYPKSFSAFCKEHRIEIYFNVEDRIRFNKFLSEKDMDLILNESESYWADREKKLIEEELKNHIETVNNKFSTVILSHPLRKKYVCKFLHINIEVENLDIHNKEIITNDLHKLDEFISKYLDHECNRIKDLYPDGFACFSRQNEDEDFGEKLQGEYFYDACLNSEECIKENQRIHNVYAELIRKYPNGIRGYEDSHMTFDDNLCRTFKPSKEEI